MSKGWQIVISVVCVLFVIAIVGASAALVRNYDTAAQTRDLAESTRSALIQACENNRGPLHEYFAGQLHQSESHDLSYYRQRFPGFPPNELRRLIQRQRGNLRDVVSVTNPKACAAQYR